jgi:hypothetical protein
MRWVIFLQLAVLTSAALGQNAPKPASQAEPKSVTVPMAIDHNRVVIDVDVATPNGTMQRIHAWVDNGDPDLWLSQHVANLMGLTVSCNGQICSARPTPPAVSLEIVVGGMKIFASGMREIKVPADGRAVATGLNAEMNLPSTVLRNYDVLIDFLDRKLTIAQTGTLKFNGVKTKVIVSSENGLIEVPSQIENKKYNLGLDIGSSINFLAGDLFEKLSATHADWPHMTGTVGPANMWGADVELKWKLMRIGRLQYGPLFLTSVPVVSLPPETVAFFEKRAGVTTDGLLGSEALSNYRVGLDYAHSTVYFDIGRTFNFPDFDVIGLILRPEDDGCFTILGVADFDGKASVTEVKAGDHLVAVDGISVQGSTMGHVWLMLGGSPGLERTLTIERAGKQFTVIAKVQHFLGETEEDKSNSKGKSPKN